MPKHFIFLVIGLFFGTGFGFLVAVSSGARMEGHQHAGDAVHDHTAHDHGGTDASHDNLTEAGSPAPQLTLTLHPDGDQSRNLQIRASNFSFAPGAVNGGHVSGQGHAHVYVNGVKIARTYAPWFHLSALPKGQHDIRVTLNANDHSQLAVDGTPLEATVQVTIE